MGSTLAICPEIEHGEAQICSAPDSEGHTVNLMTWFLHSACLHDTPVLADLTESGAIRTLAVHLHCQTSTLPLLLSSSIIITIGRVRLLPEWNEAFLGLGCLTFALDARAARHAGCFSACSTFPASMPLQSAGFQAVGWRLGQVLGLLIRPPSMLGFDPPWSHGDLRCG